MSLDKHSGELDRNQLLDEIRKRAEEAEMARIEAEEIKLAHGTLDAASPSLETTSSFFFEAVNHTSEQEAPSSIGFRDYGPPKHLTSYNEFIPLHPTQSADREPEVRHIDSIPAQGEEKSKRREKDKAKKKHHVAELLTSAHDNYQRESYERSLHELRELLTLDPENPEAVTLQAEVEKAKALSERMGEEEEQRRREEQEAASSQFIPLPRKKEQEIETQFVELLVKETGSVATIDDQPEIDVTPRRKLKRSLLWLAFGALILLGAITVFEVYDTIRGKFFPAKIGVLILPPATSNVEAYVAEGLLEELIIHLSQVQVLKVFSPATSLAPKAGDPVKSAHLYGADYVLQWSVSKTQSGLSVKLSLVDVTTSRHVLDHALQLSSDRLVEFCSNTVPNIVHSLGIDMRESGGGLTYSSTNADAYDAYLLGRYLLNHPSLASLDSVASVFERSRQSDPSFPEAEVALGWTNVLAREAFTDTSSVLLNKAAQSLQRSISLLASSSEVYRLWGMIEYFRSNYQYAINRLEQATKISPSDAEACRRLALVYFRTGRRDKALHSVRASIETDPHSHQSRSMLGMFYLVNGESKAAVREFETDFHSTQDPLKSYSDEYLAALVATNHHEQVLDILKDRVQQHPRDFVAHYDLGRMYQLAGKPKSDWEKTLQHSLQLIEDTLKVQHSVPLAYSYRGLCQTRLGLFGEGVKSDERAIAKAPTDVATLYNSARLYALQRNQSSEALMRLEKAAQRKFSLEHILDLDLQSLRNDHESLRKIMQ